MATNKEQRKPTAKAWIERIGRAKAWILGIGAVAGALTAILTFVFMLWPTLKPPEPSTEGRATLSNPQVFRDYVTLEEYLQRPERTELQVSELRNQRSEEQLERVGSIIYYDVELKGLKGQRCYLRWSVYEADTEQPIAGLVDRPAWPSAVIKSFSSDNRSRQETWVPYPQYSQGPFLVRLELYTGSNETQMRRDSAEVTIPARG